MTACGQCLCILDFLYHTPVGICVAVGLYSRRGGEEQQLHCVVTVQLCTFLTCKDVCVVKFVVFATKIKLKIS